MKLNCNVEVVNRSASVPRKKGQRSCLAIGRQSTKSTEVQLLLQNAKNKSGIKYKIDDNIDQVFTKFVHDGKATIRLKEPPHDLNIQSDRIQLKSFLHTLKLCLAKSLDPSILCVSNLNPKNIPQAPKTKVTIKHKSDYPVLEGFPRTTEELTVAGLQRKSFDRQILRLQSLRIFNLSGNKITYLPKELGTLPCLTELNLSNNSLGILGVGGTKWAWVSEGTLGKTLKLLDLSNNGLYHISNVIGRLTSLVTLNLSRNELQVLPDSIGLLTSLEYLDLSHNQLSYLPGSLLKLSLVGISIAYNPNIAPRREAAFFVQFPVRSLLEISGQQVIKSRIPYNARTIPFTLVPYLDNASFCVCGTAVLEDQNAVKTARNLTTIAKEVTASEETTVTFRCVFCSPKCFKKLIFSR